MVRPIVAVRVINPRNGEIEEIYALLDSGADRDYLSERVAHKLGLETKKTSINLVTIEEASSKMREIADIEIESIDGNYRAEVEGVLVGKFPEATKDIPPAKRAPLVGLYHPKSEVVCFNRLTGGRCHTGSN